MLHAPTTWLLLLSLLGSSAPVALADRPNVLFLAIDDLNDWIGCLGGHPQSETPNLDGLAARGVLFTRAYCQAPICNPSRVSLMTGRYPSSTGIYLLAPTDFRGASPQLRDPQRSPTLPEFFGQHGYRTWGCGKLFHGGSQGTFQDYGPAAVAGPFPPQKLNGAGGVRLWDWGMFPDTDAQQGDVQIADWAIRKLQQAEEEPFFLAAGFFRPHVPLYTSSHWWQAVGHEESIELPRTLSGDQDDLSDFALRLTWSGHAPRHDAILKQGKWRQIVHAYLAAIRFVDHQVGRVLQALQESRYAATTIVVVWSDHGFALGEKQRWAKRGLWERETRVPLIMSGPGIAEGLQCGQPVGLIDIYPTLAALCRLPPPATLEGHSLQALLSGADTERPPVLTTFFAGNHAVRSRRWRYIRYHDGSQELYDHQTDPWEWHNLAGDPRWRDVIAEHAAYLPKSTLPPVPGSRGLGVRPADRTFFGAP